MPTKLETFLLSRRIKSGHLARESGYTRQHLRRVRAGQIEPTRRCIAAITDACRRLSRELVKATDLFELEHHDRQDAEHHHRRRPQSRPAAEGGDPSSVDG